MEGFTNKGGDEEETMSMEEEKVSKSRWIQNPKPIKLIPIEVKLRIKVVKTSQNLISYSLSFETMLSED